MFGDFFRPVPRGRIIKIHGGSGIIFRNLNRWQKSIFGIATILFLVSLFYIIYLYYPLSRALVRFRINQNKTTTNEKVIAIPTGNPQLNKEYSLTVPKIMAYAKIIPNVSPYNRDEYIKVLSDNVVAQIKGSADPGSGKGKSIYIFAHSTQQGFRMVVKNAVFYLLGELRNGDFIYVNKYGKVYTYEVYKQQIVKADEIKYLTYTEPDKEILILQTCWPIGTDWNRLLIFSQLVR